MRILAVLLIAMLLMFTNLSGLSTHHGLGVIGVAWANNSGPDPGSAAQGKSSGVTTSNAGKGQGGGATGNSGGPNVGQAGDDNSGSHYSRLCPRQHCEELNSFGWLMGNQRQEQR